jgi:hypothetical protein
MSSECPDGISIGCDGVTHGMLTSLRSTWSMSTAEKNVGISSRFTTRCDTLSRRRTSTAPRLLCKLPMRGRERCSATTLG